MRRVSSFLANVNSRSRSLFAIAVRLSSVCLSSVTFVRPSQALQIFGNISTELGTLAIHWHPLKISRRSSQGKPSAGGVKHKRGSQVWRFWTYRRLYLGYKSVTLSDLERRNGRYFVLFHRMLVAFGAHCVKVHFCNLISWWVLVNVLCYLLT